MKIWVMHLPSHSTLILYVSYIFLFLPPSWSQCDANPDAIKLVVQEDKYENVLTLIVYYQMVSLSSGILTN